MKKFKIMVVGLDGATFDLLKPWAEAGKLPVLQSLMERGSAGLLSSTIPPMTAPAWTSFMTGKNPGKHGLYDWIARRKDSYDVSPVTAIDCSEPAIWDLLGEAGRRVCLLNIPMTFPPKPINGLMISGLPAPSTQVTITYPIGLFDEVENEVGEYLLYPDPGQAYSDSGVDAFLDRLYKTTDTRLKVINHLRAREDWDFFMVVFNGTDTIQHALWKYMSRDHPLHDPDKYSQYGDAILQYYQYVDHALGEITEDLDDDTVFMIMSDHGFGPFHKFIHVNNWLRQHDWMKMSRNPVAFVKSSLFKLGFTPMKVYDLLMRLGFGRLKREVVRGRGQGLLKKLFLSFNEVDWSRTVAYSLGNVGQIQLNVRGREPGGIVEPGEEYEEIRNQIIEQLWELRDPETGEKVVQEVYRREEIYSGEKLEQAPDIVFIPTRMEYFGFGEFEFGSNEVIESMKRGISGTHRPDGIFLMLGEPVKSGEWYQGARIYDLAPTIIHLMAQQVPADMDGRILAEVLKPEYAQPLDSERRTADEEGDSFPKKPSAESGDSYLSDEDKEVILKRFRDLGYVG